MNDESVADPVTWSVAKHDTLPPLEFEIPATETHAYMQAFLESEGAHFSPPYQAVRDALRHLIETGAIRNGGGQKANPDVKDQRIRTWRSVFESFGILQIDSNDKIRLTVLGHSLRSLRREIDNKVEGANDHIARLTARVLNRQQLHNPLDGKNYPSGSNTRPIRLIWRAMRTLDNKLHWEEVNRGLMWVTRPESEDAMIEHLADVRKKYGEEGIVAEPEVIGSPAIDDGNETRRRITPWLSKAGVGGLLIDSRADDNGFRYLVNEYVPVIDEMLAQPVEEPSAADLSSSERYIAFITKDVTKTQSGGDCKGKLMHTDSVVEAARKHGHQKIICLSGLPGTGKTAVARSAALELAEGDPYRHEEIQFHETTAYEDFIEGFVPLKDGSGFGLRSKVFRDINRRAVKDPEEKPYVLVVDEFTRAKPHAVLGELLTYIEHRETPFRFSLSQDQDWVAKNLVVIATMNPRDRSALVLDDAMLRRLHIVEIKPSSDGLRQMLEPVLNEELLVPLVAWFEKYAALLPFGHGIFSHVRSADDLCDLWEGTLKHFLTDVFGEVRSGYQEVYDGYPWRDA